MRCIVTKYLGPTNHRGSRVKATCGEKSVTIPWDDAKGSVENHDLTARVLASKLSSRAASLVSAESPDGRGYVYVMTSWRTDGGREYDVERVRV